MIYAALIFVACLFGWIAHDLWSIYDRLRETNRLLDVLSSDREREP